MTENQMSDKVEHVKKILESVWRDASKWGATFEGAPAVDNWLQFKSKEIVDALYSQPEKPKAEDIAKFTESVKRNSHDYQSFLSQNIYQPEKKEKLTKSLCNCGHTEVEHYCNGMCKECGCKDYQPVVSQPASTEMLLTDGSVTKVDDELSEIYEKVKKEAYDLSEKYNSSLSANKWNPNRPADRERYFITQYIQNIQKATAKAQLAKCQKSEDAIRAEYEAKIKELQEKQCVELDNCLDMKSAEETFRADQQAKTRREIGEILKAKIDKYPESTPDWVYNLVRSLKLISGQSPKQEG
jgi:hypothetical protein